MLQELVLRIELLLLKHLLHLRARGRRSGKTTPMRQHDVIERWLDQASCHHKERFDKDRSSGVADDAIALLDNGNDLIKLNKCSKLA